MMTYLADNFIVLLLRVSEEREEHILHIFLPVYSYSNQRIYFNSVLLKKQSCNQCSTLAVAR